MIIGLLGKERERPLADKLEIELDPASFDSQGFRVGGPLSVLAQDYTVTSIVQILRVAFEQAKIVGYRVTLTKVIS